MNLKSTVKKNDKKTVKNVEKKVVKELKSQKKVLFGKKSASSKKCLVRNVKKLMFKPPESDCDDWECEVCGGFWSSARAGEN